MHFHFQREGMVIRGWMAPDNPSTVPHVEIVKPDKSIVNMKYNDERPDVRDAGFHHTGSVGFHLDETTFPGLENIIDDIEIRDAASGLVLFRSYKPEAHLAERVFRFEMQAMPYTSFEDAWSRNFALYYSALERHPFDTLRWVLCSPHAESVALSGRLSISRYEHFLREFQYKFITLLKDPIEELAERLLFIRYVKSSDANAHLSQHLTGLEGLEIVARRMDLSNPNSVAEAFSYISEKQLNELSNPIVKLLACGLDEHPTRLHVELALNRLATMDLVGVRSNFAHFKSALTTLISRDILPPSLPKEIDSIAELTRTLREVKVVHSLLKLDVTLYQYAQEAVDRAIRIEQSPAALRRPETLLSGADAD